MNLKDNSVFKVMRHIETVRNYINLVIRELILRQENHDQTKLQSPEVEIFDTFTPVLRNTKYGSKKYKDCMKKMEFAIKHHNANNNHHPEHYPNGINDMTLIDLLEMICDWKAASMRHNDGNILKSIELNQKRFGYSNELKKILENTVKWLDSQKVIHYAQES